jgi:MSHA pilin protein MshD
MSAERGFTLVEMVIAIVVLGVGLAGVLMTFSQVSRNNASPVLRKQMLAIAEEMLEEITAKPFVAVTNTAASGCARDDFNDVADYNGYATTNQICSTDGTAIPALAGYSISVAVAAGTLVGVTAAQRIQVTVSTQGESLTLVGWRTNYAN